jgi:SAM-dependent methyltransferase
MAAAEIPLAEALQTAVAALAARWTVATSADLKRQLRHACLRALLIGHDARNAQSCPPTAAEVQALWRRSLASPERLPCLQAVQWSPSVLAEALTPLLAMAADPLQVGELHAQRHDSATPAARAAAGAWYTPPRLIGHLLEQTLDPLIEAACREAHPVQALLGLRVLDPACGTGHLLAAAGERLAARVAQLRGTAANALSDVVRHTLFGVDLDADAVDLCQLRLSLAAMRSQTEPRGAELDGQIVCGNAVLGWRPGLRDEAQPDSRAQADQWFARQMDLPVEAAAELVRARQVLHWPWLFGGRSPVAGFDCVLGNPPWVSHAGRAAQPLPPQERQFHARTAEAFGRHPTTHGLFVGLAAALLREGGRLGLMLPSSVAEASGYASTRRAHDRRCQPELPLTDWGDGQFADVVQPCMALVSVRRTSGRSDTAWGAPWPVARPELGAVAEQLLARMAALPRVPAALFGDRGLQSDATLKPHLLASRAPHGRFTRGLRTGADVGPFKLRPPSWHGDPVALAGRLRPAADFATVACVLRQTARFPIAALADGGAFRNSVLAGFAHPDWPAAALVAWLNSPLIRWLHFHRHRDARQPVLPQVKVGHLRSLPAPPLGLPPWADALANITARWHRDPSAGGALHQLVSEIYGLDAVERAMVEAWHTRHGPR